MSQNVLDREATGLARFRQSAAIVRINNFLDSAWFVALVCVLILASNIFGAELIVYPLLMLFGIVIAAVGRDFLPMAPIAACCYMAPSLQNNPGKNPDSVLYPENGGIVMAAFLAVFVVTVVIRLIFDRNLGGKHFSRCKRKLLPGMVILGAGYMLAGAFSGRYFENGINNMAFAALQFLSVTAMYWFFTGAIKWDRVRIDYFLWIGLGIGLLVCGEIMAVLVQNGAITDFQIQPKLIYSGWGNANNMGCMVAMMVPCAIGLARRTGRVTPFCLLGILMVLCACLTCSRTSIGGAVGIYGLSVLVSLKDRSCRKKFLLFHGIAALALVGVVIACYQQIMVLFADLVERGLNPRLREITYPEGIRTFLKNPVFGEGFYPSSKNIYEWSDQERLKAILPARWHNTVIQLLASCGGFGLLCYSFHRLQTIKLFWQKRKTPVIYIGLTLMAMLIMSLLDCHFFNIGPTLVYSIGLAFAECTDPEKIQNK